MPSGMATTSNDETGKNSPIEESSKIVDTVVANVEPMLKHIVSPLAPRSRQILLASKFRDICAAGVTLMVGCRIPV